MNSHSLLPKGARSGWCAGVGLASHLPPSVEYVEAL